MKKFIRWIFLVTLLILIVGCNSTTENTPTELPGVNTSEPTIIYPTNTPIIEYPPTILLFADSETDLEFSNEVQEIVQLFADQNSMSYEFRSNLQELSSPENLKMIVMIADVPNINELIGNSSNVKILSIGLTQDVNLIPHLITIDLRENGQAAEGFIAGYIVAMQTEEWRVGMLGVADQSDYRIGFINGAIYFCGLCLPQYPPYEDYPLYVEVNNGAEFEELKAGVDLLIQKDVKTIYLAPGIDNSELVIYLSQFNIKLLGNQKPQEASADLWIASVSWDWLTTVADVLPNAIFNDLQGNIPPKMLIKDVNQNELGLPRQNLVNEIIVYLAEGIIDPLGE